DVTAVGLRLVDREVGPGEQRVGVVAVAEHGDPHGRGHGRPARRRAGGDPGAEAVGGGDRVGEPGLAHDPHELLAAHAAHDVAGPGRAAQRLADGAQRGVAGGVAVDVVDQLEAVQVDLGEHQRASVSARVGDLGRQLIADRPRVRQPGQGVRQRQ
ncbi:MAG: hypothetical protein AVDCRST_MAG79-2706, partial [uncultured Thermoleophilia bacterium]